MNDEQARLKQQEHWRELADLLGLEPDAPSAPPPPAVAKESPPVPAKAEPAHEAKAESELAPTIDEETSWDRFEEEAEALEQDVPVPEPEPPPAEEDWHPVPGEEKARGGRRGKGRRGGRRDGSDRREPRPERRRADEDRERTPPPSRDDFREGVRGADEDLEEPPEPPAEDTSADEEEEDIFANWNVPSWNELIASLYRPDR